MPLLNTSSCPFIHSHHGRSLLYGPKEETKWQNGGLGSLSSVFCLGFFYRDLLCYAKQQGGVYALVFVSDTETVGERFGEQSRSLILCAGAYSHNLYKNLSKQVPYVVSKYDLGRVFCE